MIIQTKKTIISLILIILLISFVSADIILNQAVKPIYNLGDKIPVPITIKTLVDTSGMFTVSLICNGSEINFYKNGIKLVAGEEKALDPSLVLIREMIGDNTGFCKIKATLGTEFVLTDNFRISNFLGVEASPDKTEYKPNEGLNIGGKAIKETGEGADGFIEAHIVTENAEKDIIQLGTVNNGFFSMNISLPSDIKAGSYLVKTQVYEKDTNGFITNKGFSEFNMSVMQVPTNLELILENSEIMPGDNLKVRAILHDQTGEAMNAVTFITIKNMNDKIYEQKDVQTDETFEYPIKSNEPPEELKVFAISNQMTAESKFRIKEKEKIDVQIVNKTIQITNVGNVPYNKTLLIKIGNTSLNINLSLNVDEDKKYILSAPNGEYKVEVVGDSGNEFSEITTLTGRAIGIREAPGGILSLVGHPVLWVFVLLILGFIAFTVFKKVHKKPFFGFGNPLSFFKKKDYGSGGKEMFKDSPIIKQANKAELSLSIRGEKQDVSLVCLRINGLLQVRSGKGSAAETIKRITEMAEENKAVTYENQDYLFFMLAPVRTKTYKNEKDALEIAEKIKNILIEHNRMFNQKIEFGISLNYGTIVGKIEGSTLKFMSMGTMITAAKRIASLSRGEVLLTEKMNDLVRLYVKTEKRVRENIPVYLMKEIKRENEENKKFIRNFVDRLEKK